VENDWAPLSRTGKRPAGCELFFALFTGGACLQGRDGVRVEDNVDGRGEGEDYAGHMGVVHREVVVGG